MSQNDAFGDNFLLKAYYISPTKPLKSFRDPIFGVIPPQCLKFQVLSCPIDLVPHRGNVMPYNGRLFCMWSGTRELLIYRKELLFSYQHFQISQELVYVYNSTTQKGCMQNWMLYAKTRHEDIGNLLLYENFTIKLRTRE